MRLVFQPDWAYDGAIKRARTVATAGRMTPGREVLMQAKSNRYKVFPLGSRFAGYRVWDAKHQRNAAIFRTVSLTPEEARWEAEEWATQRNAGNDIAAPKQGGGGDA